MPHHEISDLASDLALCLSCIDTSWTSSVSPYSTVYDLWKAIRLGPTLGWDIDLSTCDPALCPKGRRLARLFDDRLRLELLPYRSVVPWSLGNKRTSKRRKEGKQTQIRPTLISTTDQMLTSKKSHVGLRLSEPNLIRDLRRRILTTVTLVVQSASRFPRERLRWNLQSTDAKHHSDANLASPIQVKVFKLP